MRKRILFSDLDATLLNDQKEIPKETKQALEAMLAQGDLFAVCTGRPLRSAQAVARRYGLDKEGCYLVSYNGGVIYDPSKGQMISYASIPPAAVQRLFHAAQQAGLYIHTYDRTDDTVLAYRRSPQLDAYTAHTKLPFRTGPDILDTITGPPAKMIVIDLENYQRLQRFQKENEAWAGELMNSFFSCEQYLEYCPAGVCKGSAVKELCAYLEIPQEASVAAGDERNDISMLQAAGIGTAPRNAHPAAKEAADYICRKDNNEGAVGEVIHKFFLGQGGGI